MEMQIFSSLVTDSRQETNKKYSIDAMMLMIVSAVLCDQCESPDDIRDFVNYNIEWFNKQINIEKAPSRETLRAFISCVNPEELMKCFDAFIQTQNFDLSKDCVAIDGKTMKGTLPFVKSQEK